ncbi:MULTISPECIES: hypothetical protein [unclassified Crossiella]|uniref:hypothetical protein n=1 Tax=unclassified Crossiella TaxID=2620835 RepID=UPI001FFFAD15|nr:MULTISPECIES: hypothetical protein [unclassified Crossiella]MCK2240973.1 hypothetical protein [Crossiella sp. S99.2]MCK2253883.1 hypothetical protein [Crossiella sp. S99.1]
MDYLRETGLSFAQARSLLIAEAERWTSWERQALRAAMPLPVVLTHLGIPTLGRAIRCLNWQAHRRGDSRPSCVVYPDSVHCFACGFHGDAFAVWQQVRGCDFRTAWDALFFEAQRGGAYVGVVESVKLRRPMRNGLDFVPLYDEVLACCPSLPGTAGATYLTSRGIDPAAAHRLGVRWLSNAALGRVQALMETLPKGAAVDAGLVDARGLFTLRCHRLLFPARRDGHTVWLQGRSTRHGVAKEGRWRSLSGIRPWPLGLDQLGQAGLDEMVLVAEGSTDWLALASRGWTTIGVPGAQAIANMWLRLLTGRRVVLAHDGDGAGDLGAQLWRERLRPFRVVPQRLPLPPDVDVCDYLRAAQSHDPVRAVAHTGGPARSVPLRQRIWPP